jgi:hypothetical protein
LFECTSFVFLFYGQASFTRKPTPIPAPSAAERAKQLAFNQAAARNADAKPVSVEVKQL